MVPQTAFTMCERFKKAARALGAERRPATREYQPISKQKMQMRKIRNSPSVTLCGKKDV